MSLRHVTPELSTNKSPAHTKAKDLLRKLLADSRLYSNSQDFRELLNFVVRLRNFAPFNAALLQIQKPGLRFAASQFDWERRFGRKPKEGARPLLIMWPFCPVVPVFDVLDTEGAPLPEDVYAFTARGPITPGVMERFQTMLAKHHIRMDWADQGDNRAGQIQRVQKAVSEKRIPSTGS